MRKILLPYFLLFALACVCNMRAYAVDVNITDKSELEGIFTQCESNGCEGYVYYLMNDINLGGGIWTPIGTSAKPFKGTFNGNGHVIKGLYRFNGTDGVGLFGHVHEDGKINQLGIVNSQIMAGGKNRVGALVGVCDGDITECWSMAEIDAAGSIVGGLVGELTSKGSLTNCYNTGIIMNGTDSIGGIVGKNSGGALTNIYYTGYAKNGNAIVGGHVSGTYIDCYYDRKLYYQMPGASGIIGIDDTQKMFSIFKGNTSWLDKSGEELYPILKVFGTNNAALLSVAPMFIDKEETAPVNHANEVTKDFKLSKYNGITWKCRNEDDEAWLAINNTTGDVSVTRPCSEIDIIVDASKGTDYSRAVYVRPIKLRDFDRSWFHGVVPLKTFCYDEEAYLDKHVQDDTAHYGWAYGSYHYRLTRDSVTQFGDTVRMDTLTLDEVGKSAYNTFMAGYKIDTKTPGTYVIKRWVHDERCVTEWVCSYDTIDNMIDGKFIYTVFPEFDPGEIEFVATDKQTDTLILMPGATLKVDVASVKPATGGGGPITYEWKENDNAISGAESADLTAHPITAKGTYTYKRAAVDSALCAPEDNRESRGQRIYIVWDRFDPDTIINLNKKRFCSADDAKNWLIDGGEAKGGSGNYSYQWYYRIDGGAPVTISGATNEDFTVGDAGLSFVPNHTYTFIRRAEDDSRFTNINADSCLTKGEFTFDIMVGLKPGEIENKRDTFIYAGSSILAKAENVTEATTGGGWLAYQWEVNDTEISGKNAKSLDMYAINGAGTYIFKRAVTDSANCSGGKLYADGERVYVVFDKFNPGNVIGDDMTYCTVDEAKEHIINATYPTGGSGTYSYQWYLLEGSTETKINGATNRTLKLGDYSSLNLEAGESYTFVRRAEDDTRFTDISSDDCKTMGQQTVYIMKELNPGAIQDGELDKVCVPYNDDGSYKITVEIEEDKPAKGETNLEYMWVRNPGGVIVGNTKNLSYTFTSNEIEIGTTYTYTREVRNPGCTWYTSKGATTQYYGQKKYGEKTITVCDQDMPKELSWTSADGKTIYHTFNTADDTWTVTDKSFDCAHDTLIRIVIEEVPEVKIDEVASLCQETGILTLHYDQTGGQPDIFRITYSPNMAKFMGTTDTIGKIEIAGSIVIRNVPSISNDGDNYLLLSLGYSGSAGCFSRAQRQSIYFSLGGYVYSKYDRVLFVDNNPDNGLVTGQKLKFVSYQWYKNGVLQEGQTGQYYHEEGKLLNGAFYVMLTDTEGHQYRSCDVIMPAETKSAAPQRSAVYPVPVGVGEPLTIEGNGSTQIISFSGECVSRAQSVNGQIVIAAPRTAGMYYVQVTNEDGEVEMHKLIVK